MTKFKAQTTFAISRSECNQQFNKFAVVVGTVYQVQPTRWANVRIGDSLLLKLKLFVWNKVCEISSQSFQSPYRTIRRSRRWRFLCRWFARNRLLVQKAIFDKKISSITAAMSQSASRFIVDFLVANRAGAIENKNKIWRITARRDAKSKSIG